MKTQFLSYGGGLLTGLFLFFLLSASPESNESLTKAGLTASEASARIQESRYVEVPIKEFFSDVARYREQHVEKLPRLSAESRNEKHSRMFTYSVNTLEAFFVKVKSLAATAEIPSEEIAIRFYYGVYPLGTKIAAQNYSSLHTLFMVPNYWSQKDKRYRDFDVQELADYLVDNKGYGNYQKDKEEVIKNYYLENMYQRDKTSTAYILDASAFQWAGTPETASFLPSFLVAPPVINQGQLCPPNCQAYNLLTYIDNNEPEFPGTR
ncbi:MAG: hypothetical protein ABIR06_03355 [Cyclobacteriaceae bacterium]